MCPLLSLFLLVGILYPCSGDDSHSKRVFMSDPDYLDTRVSHLESLVFQLQQEVVYLRNQSHPQVVSQGASVYVRWGHKSCPAGIAKLLYTGYSAGGNSGHGGAGSNYLCMPSDPIYGNRSKSLATYYGLLYGSEYETNFFGPMSANQDVPCAVCHSYDPTMLMIPGRNACYPTWTTQYNGYLASSYYGHPGQHDYVCVDGDAEYLAGGERNSDGALFYPVLSECGSLECPPYKNAEPLTCVVCTQ